MADAYLDAVTPITDLHPFLHYDPKTKSYTFTGNTLEVRIPKRFDVYGLQDVTDVVHTLGIMDLIIDGKWQCTLNILAQIYLEPSEISEMVIDQVPYLVLTLQKGDRLITSTQVPQNPNVTYGVYVEFITRGKPLYTLTYNNLPLIFDRVKELTGKGLGVDRVLFELIIAHLSRDPDDLFTQYRYTTMKLPSQLIPLRSVFHAPTNTTTRVVGSYAGDGTTAALQTRTTDHQPFEDILRGIPQDL